MFSSDIITFFRYMEDGFHEWFNVSVVCRFDLLDVCINGPKEKLDSTVISQVWVSPELTVFNFISNATQIGFLTPWCVSDFHLIVIDFLGWHGAIMFFYVKCSRMRFSCDSHWLVSTTTLQPAIYVTSLAAVELLRARDGGQQIIDSVDVTCGLSLGEYTALAFAGSFRWAIQLSKICYLSYCILGFILN